MTETTCLFCRIVRGELNADIVHSDAHVVAFHDIHPQAPVHVLVIPTTHAANLGEHIAADGVDVLGALLATASRIGRALAPNGYRVVLNEGNDAGQTIAHLHAHVLGGRALSWPPG